MLGGRLWFPPCQAGNADLPEALPASFASTEQYTASFEALLFEEAREAVRDEWGVKCGAGRAYEAEVLGCSPSTPALYSVWHTFPQDASGSNPPALQQLPQFPKNRPWQV